MKTRLFQCSTKLGLATAYAVLLRLSKDDPPGARNILLLSSSGQNKAPEVEDAWASLTERERRICSAFERVVHLDRLIAPEHPQQWRYQRSWLGHRNLWLKELGVPYLDELVLESIQVPPAWTLAQFFSEARVRVYSDGLMVYSPTRVVLSSDVLRRVSEVFFVDLLAGVTPLLLSEARPQYVAMPLAELGDVFAKPVERGGQAQRVIFLGQALAGAGIMSRAEERAIYLAALTRLSSLVSADALSFKVHPATPRADVSALASAFERSTKTALRFEDPHAVVEDTLARGGVAAVVSVFSTGLFTARGLYGVAALTYGVRECFEKLAPYENSNRIPMLAADVLLPKLEQVAMGDRDAFVRLCCEPCDVAESVERFRRAQIAVGYHMQRELLAPRKREAEALAERYPELSFYLRGSGADSEISLARRLAVRGLEVAAAKVMDPARLAKLKRDPYRFFADSKVPAVKALGSFHKKVMDRR